MSLLMMNQLDSFNNFRSFLNEGDTQMDWKETRDSHVFEIDLPGLTKEDVKLEVRENRVLCIRAEKKEQEEEEKEEKSLTWHCRERRNNGVFLREFRLPENAKVDEVKASMREGVLTIIMPKDEMKKKHKHQKKKVQISGEGGDEEVAHKGIGRFVCCKA